MAVDAVADKGVRTVAAEINYLLPDGPTINRRFAAPGIEVNTGRYGPYPVRICDGRPIKDRFSLDRHGFRLAPHRSAVQDFFDNEEVGRVYPQEVSDTIKELTGASFVAVMGWMVRTSGDLARFQPPGGRLCASWRRAAARGRGAYRHHS